MKFTEEKIDQGIEYLNGRRPTKPDWLADHIKLKDGKLFSGTFQIVAWEKRSEVIQTMFSNPLYTGGRDRLYQHIAEIYIGISRRCVADFLANNETHQVHQPLPKRRIMRPIIISGPNKVVQIDLIDMQELKGYNGQKRYILTWVDLFSKFANARGLANKTAKAVQDALDDILKTNTVSVIQSDNGGEFGKSTEDHLHKLGIKIIHSTPYNPRSQGAVDRLNKTIKSTMYKMMHENNIQNWTRMLQDLLTNYNSTIHSSTGWKPVLLKDAKLTPDDIAAIQKKMAGPDSTIHQAATAFEVGDKVRLALTVSSSERKNKFRKQIKQNWTLDTFEITNVSEPDALNTQPQYMVKNLTTNRPWGKKLWSYQMQKIDTDKLTKGEVKRVEPAEIDDASDDAPAPEPEVKRAKSVRERKQAPVGIESLANRAARKDPAPEKKERKKAEKKEPLVTIVDKISKKKKVGANNAFLVRWTNGVESWEPTRNIKHVPQYKEFMKANS